MPKKTLFIEHLYIMNNLRATIYNAFLNKDVDQLKTLNGNVTKSIQENGTPLKEELVEAAILICECALELNHLPIVEVHIDSLHSITQNQSLSTSGVITPVNSVPPPLAATTRRPSSVALVVEKKITYKRENLIRITLLRIGLILKRDEKVSEISCCKQF